MVPHNAPISALCARSHGGNQKGRVVYDTFMELSLSELPEFAKQFVRELPETLEGHACVVGLRGELGAGKTAFVQAVARALGIEERVTSPTFVIMKSYAIQHPLFAKLVHIDAYRLRFEDPDTIGFNEQRANPQNLILVEWPERLHDFPKDAPVITFDVSGEDSRTVRYG